MATDFETRPAYRIPPARLWFAFGGSACAWALQGALSVFIASNACGPGAGTAASILPASTERILLAIVTLGLLLTAGIAALTAFRDWRILAGRRASLQTAEAQGRQEFMSLAGLVVGTLCAVGILWAGLPVIFLIPCMRAH